MHKFIVGTLSRVMNRNGQNYAPALGSSDTMLAGGAVQNGRVDLFSAPPALNIPSYQQRSVQNDTYTTEATYGQIVPNQLSKVFFSAENIEALQQGIRYRVYVETNQRHTIGRQSDQELKIVMRSVYFQFAKNQSTDILGQVRTLNAKVLEWTVPEIVSNLLQYEVYRRDASTLPMPMEWGALMTSKGSKQLETKAFM
jgi:hypothetical protein